VNERSGPIESSTIIAEKLRVVWVATARTLERFSPVLKPLAIGLMDEAVELTLLCPPQADLRGLPCPPMDVIHHTRPGWWTSERRSAEALAVTLKDRKLQLLHALDVASARWVRRLARQMNLPQVISCNELADPRHLPTMGPDTFVLAANEAIRRGLLSRHIADIEQIFLVRPGVHPVRQPTCFYQPNRSATILAAGITEDGASFEAMLRAFAALRDQQTDCKFFLISNGRTERRLRALAERLNLRHELTFVDRLPYAEMPGLLKAADVFCSPVAAPGVDILSLLAMAAGACVLTSAKAKCDFLIDGQTTVQFAPADSADLLRKLQALLDDKPAACRLAESALVYVRQHHSPTQMVSQIVAIYRQAAG